MRPSDEWAFDPDWLTVNHGSYGGCPHSVRTAQTVWRERFERQPTAFLHRDLASLLRAAAATLAGFLGASGEDIGFVENATAAVNAVLASRPLRAGDEIVLLDQSYGAVRNTVRHWAQRAGARLVEVTLPFPDCPPDEVVRRLASAITGRTVLAVLDHVTSPGALVLPLAPMIAACRERDVAVLVDGAHAPGQLPLALDRLGADWYAGNLHKWLFAPVGSAFLHARPDRQDGLHPAVISHGLGQGFTAEFDWTGTRDASGWLAVPDAIALHARLGGPALMRRNAALAREGAAIVAARLGTEVAAGCLHGGSMALARIGHGSGPAGTNEALALRGRLIGRRADAPVVALAGSLWVRVSAQHYNDASDYERLAVLLGELVGV